MCLLLIGLVWWTFFYVPKPFYYGRTVLQFDDKKQSYFVETAIGSYPVSGLSYNLQHSMRPGMVVSSVLFAYGDDIMVTPLLSSKADVVRTLHQVRMIRVWLFSFLVWIGMVILLSWIRRNK